MTNSDEIKVSVKVIAYKHKPYIRKCLDSILCQKTNFRYKVVVGDDCSNDGTKEILEEYQKRYPDVLTVVVNEKNLGGMENSLNLNSFLCGEYVCGMEGDDFWVDENRLQKQVDFLDSHPQYSAVGGNHYSVDPAGKNPRIHLMRWQVNKAYRLKDHLRYGFVIHGNTIMRRRHIFSTQEERERYLKLRRSAVTMGDVSARCLTYVDGKIFVLPDVLLAHRSGANVPSSFSYQQRDRSIYYSYMCCRIVDALNECFKGKYDFNPLKANRTAVVIRNFLLGNARISREEFRQYMKTLPLKIRLLSYERCVQKIVRAVFHKFGRVFHLYIDSQEARACCQ